MSRGYFGIGILAGKTPENVGMLWRSAHAMGADFVFTVGARYHRQVTDVIKSTRHVPLWGFDDFDGLRSACPLGAMLVAVEICDQAEGLSGFSHPERALYLLGAEDHGLSEDVLDACASVVKVPSAYSLNVAVTGSIVLYDRLSKEQA